LSGGSGPWEGIVEMRRHTVKGTVCSTGFDDADAALYADFWDFPQSMYHVIQEECISIRKCCLSIGQIFSKIAIANVYYRLIYPCV
jgi:hypothetical protein